MQDNTPIKNQQPEPLRDLYNEYNPSLKLAKSYDEFKSVMQNPTARKDFYNEFNSKLKLANTFQEFDSVLSMAPKKEEPAPPVKYQKAVEEDRSSWGYAAKGLYNSFIGGFQRLGEGAVELLSGPGFINDMRYDSGLMGDKEKLIYETNKKVSPKIKERIISDIGKISDVAKIKSVTDKDVQNIVGGLDITDGIGEKDFKALTVMAGGLVGDMLLAAPTYGASYFIQGYGDGVKQYDESAKRAGIEVDNNARNLFGTTNGIVNGFLENFALSKIFGKGPALKNIQKRVVAETLNEIAQKGEKKTVEAIEKLAESKIRKLASTAKARGAKALYGAYVEGATEGIQTGLTEAAKLVTNRVQNKEVFDEEDLVKNLGKNILNSAVAGSALGLPLGGVAGINTKIDNEVLKDVAKAKTEQDFKNIYSELEKTFNANNFSEEERSAVMNQARKYAEIKQRIPESISPEAQQKIIPLINERESVEAELEARKTKADNIDKALSASETADIKLLDAKSKLINDQIVEAAEGEKYNYFEENGKYYKKFGENAPEEITKDYYDLADVSRIQYDEKVAEKPTKFDLRPTIIVEGREYYGTDHGEAMKRAIEAGEDVPNPDTPEGELWRDENGLFKERDTNQLLSRDQAENKYGIRRSQDLSPVGVEGVVKAEEVVAPMEAPKYNREEAKKILDQTDVPVDASGIALWALSSGAKVNYESFKAETGGKSEAYATGFTATNREKAPSVERLAEQLWEEHVPENMQQTITSVEIRDALIDAMLTHKNKSEATQEFIKRYSPEVAAKEVEAKLSQQEEKVLIDDIEYSKPQYEKYMSEIGEVEESIRLSNEYVDNLIKEYEQGISREGEPTPARAEAEPSEPAVRPRSIEEARQAVGETARRLGDDAEISAFDEFSRKEQSRPDFDAEYRAERVDGETVEQYLLKKYCR